MRTISQPAADEALDSGRPSPRTSSVSVVVIDWTRIGLRAADADVADAHLERRAPSRAGRSGSPGNAGRHEPAGSPSRARRHAPPSPGRARGASRTRRRSSPGRGRRPARSPGRPPPFPPTIAAVSRIRSPALKRVLEIRRHAERERHLVLGRRRRAARSRCRCRSRSASTSARSSSPPAPSTFASEHASRRRSPRPGRRGRPTPRGAARRGAARARARGARRSSRSFSTRTSSSPTGERRSSAVRSSARSCSRHAAQRLGAGERLDAAHARRDARLGHDLEQADVAGRARVRAAAELLREVAEARPRARGRRTSRRTSRSRPAAIASR